MARNGGKPQEAAGRRRKHILNDASSPAANDFQRLSESLDALLDVMKRGDWEAIPALGDRLLPALAAVRGVAVTGEKGVTLPELQTLQQKLAEATRECQERQAQIAPLVEAFTRNHSLNARS